MTTQEIIESGSLELYLYGVLPEIEMENIAQLSKINDLVKNEILEIEKAILNVSSSFSPAISSEVFEKIKTKLELKHSKIIDLKPKSNISQYLGWAASIALLLGIGYQYKQNVSTQNEIVIIQNEKAKLKDAIATAESKNKQTKEVLEIIRDSKNTVVALAGQAVSPEASAKIYWNKTTQKVYVDASGLPEPPEGKVYQIWSLRLSPTLTPTSIGLLEDFNSNAEKVFAVNGTNNAEAFGITLEPAGGSAGPTMEQLYTLGKV